MSKSDGFELSRGLQLFPVVGMGEHAAWVATIPPPGGLHALVLVRMDEPCHVGTQFQYDGAAWRIYKEMAGEDIWLAKQVKQ